MNKKYNFYDLSFEDFQKRINEHINAELNKNSDHVIVKTSSELLLVRLELLFVLLLNSDEPE